MTWRERAISCIAEGLLEYQAQQLCLNLPINPVQCQKWLNKEFYPFGVREYTPCSIWCEETKRTVFFWQAYNDPRYYPAWRNSLGRAPKSGKRLAIAAEASGQLKLF